MLSVHSLGREGAFRDVDLDLRAGEVLGIYGLQGAGRTALAEALFGLQPASTGTVVVHDKPRRIRSPRDAIALGLALVPGDRKAKGLIPNLDVRENLTLVALRRLVRGGFIDRRRERELSSAAVLRVGVRTAGLDQAITQLSGGNQQKVLLARCLMDAPRVLILHEPTSGVDVGARAEIYGLLESLLAQGVAILLITSELPELQGLSDRILVMHRGEVVARLDGGEGSERHIMQAIQDAGARAPDT
jgi:ABC-type sugar transport system ATPase subunit